MIFKVGSGYFSSQVFIQKKVWCSSIQRISNLGLLNLRYISFETQNQLKVMDIRTEPKKKLTFEEFKKIKVESFEDFSNSPASEILYNNDIEKIKKVYAEFCQHQYFSYKRHGEGNPFYDI